MTPADILMVFFASTLVLGLFSALARSVIGDFVCGFFESVAAFFTKKGRADLRLYGFMGWKRQR